jgi:hypothetical protein
VYQILSVDEASGSPDPYRLFTGCSLVYILPLHEIPGRRLLSVYLRTCAILWRHAYVGYKGRHERTTSLTFTACGRRLAANSDQRTRVGGFVSSPSIEWELWSTFLTVGPALSERLDNILNIFSGSRCLPPLATQSRHHSTCQPTGQVISAQNFSL